MKKLIPILLIVTLLFGICSVSVSAYNINFYIDVTLTEEATDLVKEGKYDYTLDSFPEYELYEVSYSYNKKYDSCYKVHLVLNHDDYMNAEVIGNELLKRDDILYVSKMGGFSTIPKSRNIKCYLTREASEDFIKGKLNFTSKSFPEVNAIGVKACVDFFTGRYYLNLSVCVYEGTDVNEIYSNLSAREDIEYTVPGKPVNDYQHSVSFQDLSLFEEQNIILDNKPEYKWNLEDTDVVEFNEGKISAIKPGCAKLTREDADGKVVVYNIYVYEKIKIKDDDITIDVNVPIGKYIKLPQWDEYSYRRAWNVCGKNFKIISGVSSSYASMSYIDSDVYSSGNDYLKINEITNGSVKGVIEGKTKYFGINERGQRVIYNITVAEVFSDEKPSDSVSDSTQVTDPTESPVTTPTVPEDTTPSQSEPNETFTTSTTGTIIYKDDFKKLSYMVVGEHYYVKDSDVYTWRLKSDGSVEFDGEKIIAKKLGEATLCGKAYGNKWYVEYDIKVIDSAPHKITIHPDKTYIMPTDLYRYFDWRVENEEIISLEKEVIRPKAEGKTYLYGTTKTGGEYTFEITVSDGKDNNHKHEIKVVRRKSATYFKKGYSGDNVCKSCGKVIKKGKKTAVLKLKTPKVTVSGNSKKFFVKYRKVKDATGFQVKYYKIKGKVVKKTYNTKKTVKKSINNPKHTIRKVRVRAFIKKNGKKAYSDWYTVVIMQGSY